MKFRWIVMLIFPALFSTVQAQELREVFRRVNPSVLVIHTQQRVVVRNGVELPQTVESVGSGVLISEDGKVLTAAHVVQAADKVEGEFLSGERVSARVIAAAPFADVAMLQLERVPAGTPVARLADSNRAEIGDMIFAIGAPYGAKHSLTVGWLSARRATENVFENLTALELFQVDMALFEGNSGGPVFDLKGEVIGLVSHALVKQEGEKGPNFAITANVARRLMLEEKRVWMGVEALMIEGPLAAAFNLPHPAGLLVQSVAEGSVGARLGLHEGKLGITIEEQSMLIGGDVVVEILGQPIRPSAAVFESLQKRLDQLRAGDTLKMKVLRAGKEVELSTRITD
ncbi:MAG TPA: trypsin-like peptidase domain-containing protein [Blastocatellia bacterium]|nr:trypsin-like peptidase domain-containing protein [Blastocatellia bacterium]HMV82039.1 trypsin-like peptidase domain-containing protein [Blastocatellia bacterium]HMX24041.1 trypsin-like peptidase domain-containing protein [Blastocatellia bacterium]HMY76194.1 trypsin-like peptidase domain-containing protein [Blastocatellia bacterium]HMZ16932.1 trypsin-like peptidase domain-containing protein [Blastocatellia bacterium]